MYDIFIATGVAIGATIALIIYSKLKNGKVEKMLMVNGVIISILGGVTLLLHDKTFIMWKPTVLYWLLAAVLLISNIFFKKNLIQQMMGKMLNPPTSTWSSLNLVWVAFLVAMGFLNLYVAYSFSEDTWVNIIAEDAPNSLDKRMASRPAHLERITTLQDQGKLVLAGPFPAIDSNDPGSAGFTGSLIVAEFDDLAAAKTWADADPFVAAGVYINVIVKPFRQTLP